MTRRRITAGKSITAPLFHDTVNSGTDTAKADLRADFLGPQSTGHASAHMASYGMDGA